jgi:lysophospholipase L1-like esterase
MKLKEKVNVLKFGGLKKGEHRIVICKSTESGQGYIQFAGLRCTKLLRLKDQPTRRIEFIGNSITCGTGSDLSTACDKGEWYDQHNAYLSYGPITARALNADWMLSAVSGIGLVRSCCNMEILMPQVFDKLNMRENKGIWDFETYMPDVVTMTLGQNDGVQDSTKFCSAYVEFISQVRDKYPAATIVCLTSPMADETLMLAMKRYLAGIKAALNQKGDANVFIYFYSKGFNKGCGNHPDLKQHEEIAAELIAEIKRIKGW